MGSTEEDNDETNFFPMAEMSPDIEHLFFVRGHGLVC